MFVLYQKKVDLHHIQCISEEVTNVSKLLISSPFASPFDFHMTHYLCRTSKKKKKEMLLDYIPYKTESFKTGNQDNQMRRFPIDSSLSLRLLQIFGQLLCHYGCSTRKQLQLNDFLKIIHPFLKNSHSLSFQVHNVLPKITLISKLTLPFQRFFFKIQTLEVI